MNKYLLFLLALILATFWLAIVFRPSQNLKIIACDVGQGDAILAIRGQTQILVDGGPNSRVVDCLARHVPFWDRTIELVLLTHPQTDHYGGLIDVFEQYGVEVFVASNVDSGNKGYQVLKNEVRGRGIKVVSPDDDMSIGLGLMRLDILHPSENFVESNSDNISSSGSGDKNVVLGSRTSSNDPNDFSIITILRYGNFDALLTGDIGPEVIDDVLATGRIQDIEYLKVPHHGSKNGLTKELLEVSTPEIAVISAGKNNRYGHPHAEVIKILSDRNIKILGTYEMGDVVIETDGEKVMLMAN